MMQTIAYQLYSLYRLYHLQSLQVVGAQCRGASTKFVELRPTVELPAGCQPEAGVPTGVPAVTAMMATCGGCVHCLMYQQS